MKKPELNALLEAHAKFGEQISSLENLHQKTTEALAEMEATGNLEDQAILDKISRLRVRADLLPERCATLAVEQETSLVGLLAGAEEFVEQTLQPKIKAVWAAAVEKVKATLAGIYSGQKLIFAVNESDVVLSLDQIARGLQRDADPASPTEYAARRLAVLDQLSKIEKSF
jgi:hypothetical protein